MKTIYYLHANGSLIHKPNANIADLVESDFVVEYWEIDTLDRGSAWLMLIGASALGADQNRVKELRELWNINNDDVKDFCNYADLAAILEDGQYIVWSGDDSMVKGIDADFFTACVKLTKGLLEHPQPCYNGVETKH